MIFYLPFTPFVSSEVAIPFDLKSGPTGIATSRDASGKGTAE
ncbi:hypothetical protein [Sphingopyxis sp. LK2115]|nr:hypothetical protein [Sphingopyxis sp. LK2115]